MDLICSVQNYHWGKKGSQSLVKKFAQANTGSILDESKPYAEFWMGVHPNGPSYLKNGKLKLSDHLSLKHDELGSETISLFGNQLPFLFKILSIEEPLSIQAHPTKEHAKELFKKYPDVYKDPNHKPELVIAITKFEALCGFRPLSEIKGFLKNIKEFQMLIDSMNIKKFLETPENACEDNKTLMKICFQSLMSNDECTTGSAIEKLIDRLENSHSEEQKKFHFDLVKRLNSSFPKDIGVFCIYWLNYVTLTPGQSLFLAPNEPHSYLSGDCVECMANSDNVVRAGLTPKFRDIQTLCGMLTYKTYELHEIMFQPVQQDEYSQIYYPPVKDFAIARYILPPNFTYCLKERKSASILLVLEGQGKLNLVSLEFGKVLFLPAKEKYCITSDGLTLFEAFCNI